MQFASFCTPLGRTGIDEILLSIHVARVGETLIIVLDLCPDCSDETTVRQIIVLGRNDKILHVWHNLERIDRLHCPT